MLGGAFTDIFDSQGNGTVIFRVDKLDFRALAGSS